MSEKEGLSLLCIVMADKGTRTSGEGAQNWQKVWRWGDETLLIFSESFYY